MSNLSYLEDIVVYEGDDVSVSQGVAAGNERRIYQRWHRLYTQFLQDQADAARFGVERARGWDRDGQDLLPYGLRLPQLFAGHTNRFARAGRIRMALMHMGVPIIMLEDEDLATLQRHYVLFCKAREEDGFRGIPCVVKLNEPLFDHRSTRQDELAFSILLRYAATHL